MLPFVDIRGIGPQLQTTVLVLNQPTRGCGRAHSTFPLVSNPPTPLSVPRWRGRRRETPRPSVPSTTTKTGLTQPICSPTGSIISLSSSNRQCAGRFQCTLKAEFGPETGQFSAGMPVLVPETLGLSRLG